MRHVPTWFPGAGFKRFAEVAWKHQVDFHEMPYNQVQQQLVRISVLQEDLIIIFSHKREGTAAPSIARTFLEDAGENIDNAQHSVLSWTLVGVYGL